MSNFDDLSAMRICVIKPSALGDVVQALPMLTAVRRRFPQAHVAWVINANLANLLEGHARIDQLIPFQRHGGVRDWWRLMNALRHGRFDLTIDLQGLLRTGLMTAATGAKHRIGLMTAREGAEWFYTATLSDTDRDLPAWRRYWRVAEVIDPTCPIGGADLPLAATDRRFAQQALHKGRQPWFAVCPGARWETKRWPAEKFVAIAARAQRELGASIVILGSPAERELCRDVASLLEQRIPPSSVLNLGGDTSLRQLAAVLEASQWAITNDSGPLHLADAVGTPTVGLFTCTSPIRSGPPPERHELIATRLDCAAGYHKTCPLSGAEYHACHHELDVERVWAGLARLVEHSIRLAG